MTATVIERAGKSASSKDQLAHATSQTVTPPRTPTATTVSAHRLLSEIQAIYDTLSTMSSLAPGPQVDKLLSRLVNLCIEPYSAEFTTSFFNITGVAHLCSALRPLCATSEGELEKHWAARIMCFARSCTLACSPLYTTHQVNKQQQHPDPPQAYLLRSPTTRTTPTSPASNAPLSKPSFPLHRATSRSSARARCR